MIEVLSFEDYCKQYGLVDSDESTKKHYAAYCRNIQEAKDADLSLRDSDEIFD